MHRAASGISGSICGPKEVNPIFRQPAQQEILADALSCCRAYFLRQEWGPQLLHNPLGCLLDRFPQKPILSIP